VKDIDPSPNKACLSSRANSARLLAADADEGILATVDELAHFEITTP